MSEDSTGSIASLREAIQGLKNDMEDTNISLREGEMTLMRLTRAIERLGLPKDVRQVVTELMRVIQTVRLLQISISMLEAAEGPVGWLFAGMSFVATGLTAASAVSDVTQVM